MIKLLWLKCNTAERERTGFLIREREKSVYRPKHNKKGFFQMATDRLI